MWRDEFKPLPAELWLSELGNFLVFCAAREATEDDRAVRRAFHIAMIAPLAVRKLIAPSFSEEDLEAMLEREGSLETAVRLIQASPNVEVGIRRRAADYVGAVIHGDEPSVEFAAPTPTRSLLGAWAEFLTTVEQG